MLRSVVDGFLVKIGFNRKLLIIKGNIMILEEWWKNFVLNCEIDILGMFIYNVIRVLEELEFF